MLFQTFRQRRRIYVFCAWCGVDKRSDKLKDHCESVHNCHDRALGQHEEPKRPIYKKPLEYIASYPTIIPSNTELYKPYRLGCRAKKIMETLIPEKPLNIKSRREKKAETADRTHMEYSRSCYGFSQKANA